jgi:toxin YoeB
MSARSRDLAFRPEFLRDLQFWIKNDKRNAVRLLDLALDVIHDPFTGLGKPESLKYLGPDIWSRRLSLEHRVVYVVQDDRIIFLQARYHY